MKLRKPALNAHPQYKWVIAAILFVIIFIGLGFCSTAKPMYTAAITQALHIPRSAYAINDSCRYITTTVLNLFFGVLVFRFGTKKLIVGGVLALIISSLLYSYATTLPVLYLGGVFLGIGVAWTTTSMVGVVTNKWFSKNKGMVMGAILASNGVGAALCTQITSPIVYQEGNPFGYRQAYLLITVLLVAVAVLTLIFYREHPPQLQNVHPQSAKEKRPEWDGFSHEEILRKPYFYGLLLCVAMMMFFSAGSFAQPHFTDIGLNPDFVAGIFSVQTILLAASKFLMGFLYDKLGLRFTLNLCLITRVLSFLIVLFVDNSPVGQAIVILYSLLTALSSPLETIILPILALDFFGNRSYVKVVGYVTAISTAGQALGTPAMNLVYDWVQDYFLAFLLCGVSTVLILITVNSLLIVSKRDKDQAAALKSV